ncbi:alpha/beta hydrolase [Polaromonas sp.]|uniref:alpha/beta fold hydrolase n=1 Tax=Polaromonas sp. TaxID=1869339 RepID=UPI0032636046
MVTLVVLPGMDGTGELLAAFAAAVSPGIKVKVLRYPATEALDYAGLEAVARAALPVNEPYVLLGESFSGPIAIALAASRPPQLLGLVLCCTFARNPRPLMVVLRPWVGLLPMVVIPVGLLARLLLGRFYTMAWRHALSRALGQVARPVLRARLRAVLSADVSPQLAEVVVPTLYLRAAHDAVVPFSAGQHVLEVRPGTTMLVLEAPHFLLQVVPAEAARAVSEFISSMASLPPTIAIK